MIFRSVDQWREFRKAPELKNATLGFVPTMGALHQGHLSLVKKSKSENQKTLVSIFVNPTQFNDPEDFKKYPKTESQDLEKLKKIGVDYVLLPEASEIYRDHYEFRMSENHLSKILCGQFRPGHFDGVLTVVLKFLNLAQATKAYFGEKDYQQYLLIKKMAESFFIPTEIIGLPTVREKDGLAMSSRNQRLDPLNRRKAALFPELLYSSLDDGQVIERLEKEGFRVDYIESHFHRRFGAVHLGDVRLIDNVQR